jgi:hypothetical protein
MGFPCGEGKKNSSLCPGHARGEAELPPHETKERNGPHNQAWFSTPNFLRRPRVWGRVRIMRNAT